MLIRKRILPRRINDACVSLFTICVVPQVYYFELFIVLPKFMPLWSPCFWVHFIIGSFMLFNITANYLAIILCDTSIRGRILPTSPGPNTKFCAVCECISPARSFHCNHCNICILKRDHHCIFTSCCIGHENLRFFLMFIAYLFIATIYATYYNIFFVLEFVELHTFEALIKLIFPLATLFVNYSTQQMYLFLVVIIIIGCIFTGVLLYFHINLIIKGLITHEKNHKIMLYDLGWEENVKIALGEKWRWIWLSPFTKSRLTSDGINWNLKQSFKAK